MRFSPRFLCSAGAVAITCAVSAAAFYYRRRRKPEINEVMIFCKLQYNVCNYFDKLISFIDAAKHSVSVCMPSIHNPAIQARLVELIKRKNIKARIIIDGAGYNSSTAFFLKELSEAGAEIKWKVSEYRMQHKFCLVDDEVLMTGTLDWGNDMSFDNWNYVYVTNKIQLVEPVIKEFYSMWGKCQVGIQDVINAGDEVVADDDQNDEECVDEEGDGKVKVNGDELMSVSNYEVVQSPSGMASGYRTPEIIIQSPSKMPPRESTPEIVILNVCFCATNI